MQSVIAKFELLVWILLTPLCVVKEYCEVSGALWKLLPLASEWQNIGTFLEIPPGKLKTIKSDNPNKVKDCLREMLTEWLDTTDPHPTWENLAKAIHPFSKNIAMEKYCNTLTS